VGVLFAAAAVVTPAAAEEGFATDPAGDGPNHGDATGLQIINETAWVTLGVFVVGAEDPATAPAWTSEGSETRIEWNIDTNGAAPEEYVAVFAADGQGPFAGVFTAADEPLCEAETRFASPFYEVRFPRSCIGALPTISVNARVFYDATPGGASDTSTDSVPNSNFAPAVAPDEIRVGVVGADDALWAGSGFGPQFAGLGGRLIAAPAVAALPSGEGGRENGTPLYVGTGTDNQLWARTTDLGWRPLSSGGTFCKGGPGAVYNSLNNSLTVACRGVDDALWVGSGPLAAGSIPDIKNWARIGGTLKAGPSVAVGPNQQVTFLVVGLDDHVWQTTGGPFTGMSWQCKGHVAFSSNPDVGWFGCRGLDDALWAAVITQDGWAPARRLGGVLTDGPGVAVAPDGAVFAVQGLDQAVWQIVMDNLSGEPMGGFSRNGGKIKFGVGAAAL
jgi:hypothetical protein